MSIGIQAPDFKLAFLGPRFWPTWIGAGLLYAVTWLPLPLIKLLGKGVGKLLGVIGKKRVAVARRNLALCYPDWSTQQIEQTLEKNLERAGIALFESAMGWWWPTWRIKRISEVEGLEHAHQILKQGKGVFGLAIHNMNVELAARVIGYHHQCVGFYREHNNPLMNYFQYRGRNQSNKYMIHKRNSKALIQAMDEGELCLYLPDQDYGREQSIFVPFGGVEETATTTATMMFARRANCIPLMVVSQYSDKGCKVKFYPAFEGFADMSDKQALTMLNERILDVVNEQPESYLWMHKRFKTRPNPSDPSLY